MKVFQESKNIFEMNNNCEAKLVEPVKQAKENVVGEKQELLSCATLEMFDK